MTGVGLIKPMTLFGNFGTRALYEGALVNLLAHCKTIILIKI